MYENDTQTNQAPEVPLVEFVCPNDGVLDRDDVIFLCNKCDSSKVTVVDGIYMCPSCLEPGQNFECMLCGSTEVTMQKKEANN